MFGWVDVRGVFSRHGALGGTLGACHLLVRCGDLCHRLCIVCLVTCYWLVHLWCCMLLLLLLYALAAVLSSGIMG
jgi:hypothetical protein